MHHSLPFHTIVFGCDSCVDLVMTTHVLLVVIERPAVCPCGLAEKALGTAWWSERAAETSLQTPTTENEKSHQRAISENSSLKTSRFTVSKIMNDQHM